MAIIPIINFDETYEPISIESDLSQMTFNSPQIDGSNVLILVKITPHPDQYLPNVYNLGFGPPNEFGSFNDDVKLRHEDNNKLFSTVLLLGLTFLQENQGATIGVDGSDDTRAALYHLMFKANRAYLSEFFKAIGVDWYVRIFRDGSYEVDEFGNYIAKPRPELFDYERDRHDLYRYYMFSLK
ncbi:MAG TPA: hypothetical protein VIM55_00845 [Mucilaginibacter sp.]